MKQLIEQILDEMKLDHIPKEWVSCMKGVIMAIEHTYVEKEKEQLIDAHIEGQRVFDKHPHTQWTTDQAELYYNENYGEHK